MQTWRVCIQRKMDIVGLITNNQPVRWLVSGLISPAGGGLS